ncbi:uncharacterized protein F4822DRAFT_350028 [Hypoxylon trugodes]|uniref:uncharacterized protein n=1 Tax=Hypoxylon trugodes TaxID=326681 RepID=UPI002193DC26|nr:uncharacterized protein F4822DRAFT_350028 [Hypoxylon trugodes]KAI1385634.1 hypothetical protein F4822DRAFT_350028 [Hypoxylon trugodes]
MQVDPATLGNRWLCYRETVVAHYDDLINDEDYYGHLLRHLAGEVHEDDIDNCTKHDGTLEKWDGFAHTVQSFVREMGPVEDKTPFNLLFKAYRDGRVDDVIAQHDKFDEKQAGYVRRLLAIRSLLDRRADVLRFALEKAGFEYTQKFIDEAYEVDKEKDPKTYAALEESEFRRIHPRKDPPWVVFDVGGRLPVDW